MTSVGKIKKIVGNNIVRLRKQLGISQETLSERVSLTQNSLSRLETGKNLPSVETMRGLAIYFNIEPYELFIPPDGSDMVKSLSGAKDLLSDIIELNKDNKVFIYSLLEFAKTIISYEKILK